MKEYVLCLDESGDFGSDLTKRGRPACVVGGILYDKSRTNTQLFDSLINTWKNIFPHQAGLIPHATELLRETYRTPEIPARITWRILHDLHEHGIEFVIIEDDARVSIIDNNATYINLLAEGVIQLLQHLSATQHDVIKLNCRIARRSNMTGNTVPYHGDTITLEEYKYRINERLAFVKARIGNPRVSRSMLTVQIGDARYDAPLIAADHVSHFWFSRKKPAFREKRITDDANPRNKDTKSSVWEMAKDYYSPNLRFSIFSRDEDEYLRRMMLNNTLSDALYEHLSGGLSEKATGSSWMKRLPSLTIICPVSLRI